MFRKKFKKKQLQPLYECVMSSFHNINDDVITLSKMKFKHKEGSRTYVMLQNQIDDLGFYKSKVIEISRLYNDILNRR